MHGHLALVNQRLQEAVVIPDSFLTEVAGHLIKAGGKRHRPLFAVASAATRTEVTEDIVMGGVAVELVQVGTLYHDDVIDEAETRRGVESVNARWGNVTAILSGDFLLAKASEIAASLGVEVADLLARTIGQLCAGEVRELQDAYNLDRSEDHYFESIDGKTASLFATACRVGAIVGELERDDIDALTEFGRCYGMAFQMVDDVLDLVATSEQLGKPAGLDIAEGVYNLPVLRALGGPEGDALRSLLGAPIDGELVDRARSLVRSNGAVASSLEDAQAYVDRAVACLEPFGDSPAKRALARSAQFLLTEVEAAV